MSKEGMKKDEHLVYKILGHMTHEGGNRGARPKRLLVLTPTGLLHYIFSINKDQYLNYTNTCHCFNPRKEPNFFLPPYTATLLYAIPKIWI